MPIEVKELIIKARIPETGKGGKQAGGGKMDEEAKDELIMECVEKVLSVLRKKGER